MMDDPISQLGPRTRAGFLKHLKLEANASDDEIRRALASQTAKLLGQEEVTPEAFRHLVLIVGSLEARVSYQDVLAAVAEELDTEDSVE